MTRKPENPGDDGREARLAEALRANLARRKAQGRARAAAGAPDAGATPDRCRDAPGHAAGRNQSGTEPGES